MNKLVLMIILMKFISRRRRVPTNHFHDFINKLLLPADFFFFLIHCLHPFVRFAIAMEFNVDVNEKKERKKNFQKMKSPPQAFQRMQFFAVKLEKLRLAMMAMNE